MQLFPVTSALLRALRDVEKPKSDEVKVKELLGILWDFF